MRVFSVRDSSEAIANNPEMSSNEALSHSLNCVKLLRGRADIYQENRIVHKCRFDYLTNKRTKTNLNTQSFVRSVLGTDVTYESGLRVISASRKVNVSYYRKLETELCHCIVNYSRGDYLKSFLHLYRAIEKVSASFPLTYIAGQSDFEGSIENLRKYFKDDKGELSFSQKFSEFLASENSILSELDIDFITRYEEMDDFRILTNQLKSSCPGYIEDTLDLDMGTFSIKFTSIVPFFIECRNRLFHFSNSGQKNIDIDAIGDLDELCRLLVSGAMNWVSIAFDEVWRRQIDRIVII